MTCKFISLTFKDGSSNPLEVLSVVVDDRAFPSEKERQTAYRTSTGSLTGIHANAKFRIKCTFAFRQILIFL